MDKSFLDTVAFRIMIVISFLFLIIIFSSPLESFKINIMLKSYEPTINRLNEYKTQHGIYPLSLDMMGSDTYKTFNNNKDFKLHIGKYPTYYNYCTSKNFEGCDENVKTPDYKYKKIGKWIEEFYWGSL